MPLSKENLQDLIGLIDATNEDDLDCDHCLDRVAEYADHELANLAVSDAIEKVREHLASCPCCADEYRALLDGLAALEES